MARASRGIEAAGGSARQGFQHIDGRIAAAFADAAIQHHMPVQNAAHRIRYRLVMVPAFHQHGEQSSDLPG
jgi:hypothetical protein